MNRIFYAFIITTMFNLMFASQGPTNTPDSPPKPDQATPTQAATTDNTPKAATVNKADIQTPNLPGVTAPSPDTPKDQPLQIDTAKPSPSTETAAPAHTITVDRLDNATPAPTVIPSAQADAAKPQASGAIPAAAAPDAAIGTAVKADKSKSTSSVNVTPPAITSTTTAGSQVPAARNAGNAPIVIHIH